MAHAMIQSQQIGDTFEGVYYVESSFVKQTVNKKDYTDLTLRDKSGSRNVKFWGTNPQVVKGGWVFIAAGVDEYKGVASVVAKNIEPADTPADLSDYIPAYDDQDKHAERFDEIRKELKKVEDAAGLSPLASTLVDEVYGNSSFFSNFIVAPGSVRPHYGRQGGLLANTVRVADAAIRLADQYGLSNSEKTTLIAAALLCRIGAVEAFEFRDCMPVATRKGILLGINNLTTSRITLALKRAVTTLKAANKNIDQESVALLLHSISSHDSVAVVPMTREAMILNMAFHTDSQLVDAIDFIATDVNVNEEFTAYDPAMKRQYYTGIRSPAKS